MYQANPSNGLSQAATARDATELEGLINTLRQHMFDAHTGVRSIFCRVLPPTPSGTSTAATIAPVATTYADRIRELIAAADDLRSLVGELNGRI
jgi:hypothetical protein